MAPDPWECPRCHCLFGRPGFDHEPCGDPASATLAAIRDEALCSIAYADDHACPDAGSSCSAHNALRLLAAVEAAWALAANAQVVRAAITAALTGDSESEPPQTEADRRAADEAIEALRERLAGDG